MIVRRQGNFQNELILTRLRFLRPMPPQLVPSCLRIERIGGMDSIRLSYLFVRAGT